MSNEDTRNPRMGPSFQKRVIAAHSFLQEQEQKYQNGGELYPYIGGDHFLDVRIGELGVTQRSIVRQIRELAENPSIMRPITYLDVGGGFGEASIVMAISLEDLIKSGRVIVLVSNLEFIPKLEDIKRLLKDDTLHEFFQTNMHRVKYIKSDVGHLSGLTMDTQYGLLKLFGNLDFIYEYNALTHSRTPDRDLMILGRSLSRWGTLMFDSEKGYSDIPDELKKDIDISFQVGINNLKKMGLKESKFKAQKVFQQCDAPSLVEVE